MRGISSSHHRGVCGGVAAQALLTALDVTLNTKMPFWAVLTKAGICSPALGPGVSCAVPPAPRGAAVPVPCGHHVYSPRPQPHSSRLALPSAFPLPTSSHQSAPVPLHGILLNTDTAEIPEIPTCPICGAAPSRALHLLNLKFPDPPVAGIPLQMELDGAAHLKSHKGGFWVFFF